MTDDQRRKEMSIKIVNTIVRRLLDYRSMATEKIEKSVDKVTRMVTRSLTRVIYEVVSY